MRLFVLCCCIALGGCVSAKDPETPAREPERKEGADWPCFLGPAGTSVSPEKGILTRWPKDGLRVVWAVRTGEGYGAPSIKDGKLYLFDRIEDSARLRCLDAATGKLLWQFDYKTDYVDTYSYSNGPRCCPVVDGDRVYLHGSEGMLHCVRTSDGKLLWKVDTKKDYGIVQNFFGVGSAPVVEGDLLIVQVGGSPPGSDEVDFARVKGNGSGVVAFDKRTGKEKWRVSKEVASYATPVLATIGNKRWCFVFARGGLVAVDPAKGKEMFHFPWRARAYESVNASNPVVVGDKVLLSETYGPGAVLLKIKPDGCDVVWSDKDKRDDKSMQCHWMTPIFHEGYLYGSSGRHDSNAELRCIEFNTGKVQWTVEDLTRTSLLMVDGHFLCLSENGALRLLKVNPKKFEEVAKMEIVPPGKNVRPQAWSTAVARHPFWAAPVLSHGLLYLRGGKYLICYELIPAKK